jgi:MFS family permease
MIVPPLFFTGLLIYQGTICEMKGWPVDLLAVWFTSYAVTRGVSGLLSGPLIDRYGAVSLYAVHLLPFAAGLVILDVVPTVSAAPLYLALTGMTIGSTGGLKTSFWAEVYGTANLGAIRGLAAFVMVAATSAGSALGGWVFETRIPLPLILRGAVVWILASSVIAALVCRGYRTAVGQER